MNVSEGTAWLEEVLPLSFELFCIKNVFLVFFHMFKLEDDRFLRPDQLDN